MMTGRTTRYYNYTNNKDNGDDEEEEDDDDTMAVPYHILHTWSTDNNSSVVTITVTATAIAHQLLVVLFSMLL